MTLTCVKKEDWKTCDMPDNHNTFDMECHLSKYNLSILQEGHLPRSMEDRWFTYYDDGKLYLHRSWTGHCIFILEIDIEQSVIHVTVNQDKDQYSSSNPEHDKRIINELLHRFAYHDVKLDWGDYHGSLSYFLEEILDEEDDKEFENMGILENVKLFREAVYDNRFENKEDPYMEIGRMQFPEIEIGYDCKSAKSTDKKFFFTKDVDILWYESKVLLLDIEIPEKLRETGWHLFSFKEGFDIEELTGLLIDKRPDFKNGD